MSTQRTASAATRSRPARPQPRPGSARAGSPTSRPGAAANHVRKCSPRSEPDAPSAAWPSRTRSRRSWRFCARPGRPMSPAQPGARTAEPSRSSCSASGRIRSRGFRRAKTPEAPPRRGDGFRASRSTSGTRDTLAAMPELAGRVADAFESLVREHEERWLAPMAIRSYESRGRAHAEEECRLRTPFQRDRDRIVHSKAFRRLRHKTQVFVDPEGDHFRTRLTHTLETTGIARGVARAVRLNEDLVEAIGLGHDLGHPPFGHAGEDALDELLRA